MASSVSSSPSPDEQSEPLTPRVDPQTLVDDAVGTVRAGFMPLSQILENTEEACFDGCLDDDATREVLGTVRQSWRRIEAERIADTRPSDHERLASAFGELERDGILARMNFACCMTCAYGEIGDERTPVPPERDGAYPYREWASVLFHEQDAARLGAPNEPLYLAFSCWPAALAEIDPHVRDLRQQVRESAGDHTGVDEESDTKQTDAALQRLITAHDTHLGHHTCDVLRRHGFDVSWPGTPSARIAVTITDWRKQLPTVA